MPNKKLNLKVNIIFSQITIIGLGFFAALLFLTFGLYGKLVLAGKLFFKKLDTMCGCGHYVAPFLNNPWFFVLGLILSAIIIAFFVFAVLQTARLWLTTAKFIKLNTKRRKNKISAKLKKIAKTIKLENRVIEIKSNKPIIFCYGFKRPKICVSDSIVKKLTYEELTAVLLHEQHHILVREPIKLFAVKIITKIFFFIPGLKKLTEQYFTFSEVTADERATKGFRDVVPLAKALYRIIKWEEKLSIKQDLALSFFSIITEERINKLTDSQYNFRSRIGETKADNKNNLKMGLWLSFLFVFLIGAGIFIYLNNTALTAYENSSCESAANEFSRECRITGPGCETKINCGYENL